MDRSAAHQDHAPDVVCDLGDFQFDSHRRQLLLQGQALELPRQLFDFLGVLLEHDAGAVVTHQTLRSRVWRGRQVGAGAIAQAALALRRVLGRSQHSPVRLETVRGVGYRLHGQVRRIGHRPTPAATAHETLWIRVMPLVDATVLGGDDWASRGLAGLIAQAIEVPGRLHASVCADSPASAEPPPHGEAGAPPAWAELRLFMGRQDGVLWLDATLKTMGSPVPGSLIESVRGRDLMQVCRQLVSRLRGRLMTDGSAVQPDLLPWEDDWANLTYARALHAVDTHDHRQALPLLRALQQCAPPRPAATLSLLHVLAIESPDEAPAVARALLRMEGLPHDTLALTHALLARCLREDEIDPPARRPNLDAARYHLDSAAPSASALLARRNLGQLEWQRFERAGCPPDAAPALLAVYADIEHQARVLARTVDEAEALSSRAGLLIVTGGVAAARPVLERAAAAFCQAGLDAMVAVEKSGLALVDWHEGDLPAATRGSFDTIALLEGHSPHGRRLAALCAPALVICDSGHPVLATRLQALVAAWDAQPGVRDSPHVAVAHAVSCLAQGRVNEAVERICQALVRAGERRDGVRFQRPWAAVALRLAGATGSALDVRAQLEALPRWRAINLCPEFRLGLQHAEAAALLLRGDRAACRQRLQALATADADRAVSRERSLALLDLCWMALQDEDIDTAAATLGRLSMRFLRHPLALAAHAQVLGAQGRTQQAQAARDAAMAQLGWAAPAWLAGPAATPHLLSQSMLPRAP